MTKQKKDSKQIKKKLFPVDSSSEVKLDIWQTFDIVTIEIIGVDGDF